MKKIIWSGFVAGLVLLALSVSGLYVTIMLFPDLASQYFDPVFDNQSDKVMFYYVHPFILSLALSWFWSRFKGILTGGFITKGIEFGLIYVLIAILPMMLLIYSSLNVSLSMVATWFLLALLQGITAGLIFEKLNP